MKTPRKKFDCVEMMHKGAEKVRRETEGMSREQELAYWQRGTEELKRLQDSTQKR